MAKTSSNVVGLQLVAAVEHGRNLGAGARILLLGLAGTQKNVAVEGIASELGRDLYRVDLSKAISKYIGETEKNLNRIFDRAISKNWILFFDEADALFGKRTGVRDSNDRFANIQTSYLLRRLEDYRGVAILATNSGERIDGAFLRRCALILRLPPSKESTT